MAPIVGSLGLVGIHPLVVIPSAKRVVIGRQTLESRGTGAVAFIEQTSVLSIEFLQFELLAVHALAESIDAHIRAIDEHIGIFHAHTTSGIWLKVLIIKWMHLHPKFVGHLVAKAERLCP